METTTRLRVETTTRHLETTTRRSVFKHGRLFPDFWKQPPDWLFPEVWLFSTTRLLESRVVVFRSRVVVFRPVPDVWIQPADFWVYPDVTRLSENNGCFQTSGNRPPDFWSFRPTQTSGNNHPTGGSENNHPTGLKTTTRLV